MLGLAALLAASSREGTLLLVAGAAFTLVALTVAASDLGLLLRRSRWLLLTMLVLFGWLTPGTPLAIPGASQEGLLLAGDNIARLLIALSTVALLLKALSPPELVAGMRSLLTPLALLGIPRDRFAVRLALTLHEVESSRKEGHTESACRASTLALPASAFGMADFTIGVGAGVVILLAWLT